MRRNRTPGTPDQHRRRFDLVLDPELALEIEALAARRGWSKSMAYEHLLRLGLAGTAASTNRVGVA